MFHFFYRINWLSQFIRGRKKLLKQLFSIEKAANAAFFYSSKKAMDGVASGGKYEFMLDVRTGELMTGKPTGIPIHTQIYNINGKYTAIFAVVDGEKGMPIGNLPHDIATLVKVIGRYNSRRHAYRMSFTPLIPIVDVTVIDDRIPSVDLYGKSGFIPGPPVGMPPVVDVLHSFSDEYSRMPVEHAGDVPVVKWPVDKYMYKGMETDVSQCVGNASNERAEGVGFFSTEQVAKKYVYETDRTVFVAKPLRELTFAVALRHDFIDKLYHSIVNDMTAIIEPVAGTARNLDAGAIATLDALLREMEIVQIVSGVFCTFAEQVDMISRLKTADGKNVRLIYNELMKYRRFIDKRYRINGEIFSGLYRDLHRISIRTWIDVEFTEIICKRLPGVDGFIGTTVVTFEQYGRYNNNRIDLPYHDEEVVLCSQKGKIEWTEKGGLPMNCLINSEKRYYVS